MYSNSEFKKLVSQFGEKDAKRLNIPIIIRLINKLNENSIEDVQIKQMLSELTSLLYAIHNGDTTLKKQYRKIYALLTNYTIKTYKLRQKGAYLSMYIGVGLTLGIAIFAWDPTLIGVGIAIGIAIGVTIGSSLEGKATKDGKTY